MQRPPSPLSSFASDNSIPQSAYQFFEELDDQFNLSDQEKLLYASHEDAYWIGAPTHCRYYTFPLRRVRSIGERGLRDSTVYRETEKCVLSYEGEFIVTDFRTYPKMADKIAKEYETLVVSNGSGRIVIHKRLSNLP